jgi:hypothetical protein
MYVLVYVYVCMYVCIYVCISICVCMYVCISICVCMYMYTYLQCVYASESVCQTGPIQGELHQQLYAI